MARFDYAVQASLASNPQMQERVRQAMLTHAAYISNLPLGENEELGKRRRSFAVEALRAPDYIAQSMTMGVVSQLEDGGDDISDNEILSAVTVLWDAYAGSAST
ncbi:MAG: hypothetical protein ACOYD4_06850 [Solirubrobacterales bacterium]